MTVTLPEVNEVRDLINMILGENSPLRVTKKAWDLTSLPDGTHITPLCNTDGENRGAVVTNINATLYLGGKLVMMPEARLADHAQRLEVEESIVEAVEEIVNMIRSAFNKQPGNEHMSPRSTRVLDKITADGEFAWMLEPGARLDLAGDCSFGDMRMSILFR